MARAKNGKRLRKRASTENADNLLLAAFDVLDPGVSLRSQLYEFVADTERARAVRDPDHAMHLVRERLAELRHEREHAERGRAAALDIALACGAPEPWSSEATGKPWDSRFVVSTVFPSLDDGRTAVLRHVEDQPHERLRRGEAFGTEHRKAWATALGKNEPDEAMTSSVEHAVRAYIDHTPPGEPVRVRRSKVREILRHVAEKTAEIVQSLDSLDTETYQEAREADIARAKLVRWGFPTPQLNELGEGQLIPTSDVSAVLAKLPRIAAGARLALADPDLTSSSNKASGELSDTEAFEALVCALADVYEGHAVPEGRRSRPSMSARLNAAGGKRDRRQAPISPPVARAWLSDSSGAARFVSFVQTVLDTVKDVLPEYRRLRRMMSTVNRDVKAILRRRKATR